MVLPRAHLGDYFDAGPRLRERLWDAVAQVKAELDREFPGAAYTVWFDTDPGAAHLRIHVVPGSVAKHGGARVITGGLADPLAAQLLPALGRAREVDLAIGFVFERGVAKLESRLIDALERPRARIRILTGDYQDVTEPDALRRLLLLGVRADAGRSGASLELKIYQVTGRGDSFHPKAWIIGDGARTQAWVGSSNLSVLALETGLEWSYQIVDTHAVAEVRRSFEALWAHPRTRIIDEAWIAAYEARRVVPERFASPVPNFAADEPVRERPVPRPGIQSEALLKLEQTRAAGNRSGLVVLATGLGKTYLSAFDSQGFARVLFVAHREEILRQALTAYQAVRPGEQLGLYNGAEKQANAQVLFASVQTLSAPEVLDSFDPRQFDYIVIDEFHHAAAPSYRRIIDHFEPQFLLGLTATPNRPDGLNLLTLCDGNEVYTADIVAGITTGKLAPFHYFGIADDAVYEPIPWRSYPEHRLLSSVETVARARLAHDRLREHTQGRVCALGFCVSQSHAKFMAEQFTALGVACAAVYGGSPAPRVETLAQLEAGELEVVFCVDMFNEGVDLPAVDTVLMLRPTESPIVWTQQLGRGLRYREGKTLTVLDMIGNHEIFAQRPELLLDLLGRSSTSNTDALASLVRGEFELPPGVHVEFELEAKDMLAQLRAASRQAGTEAERWLLEFRAHHGRRPSAIEAEHAGRLKQLSARGPGWFAYLAAIDGFDDPKEAAVVAERGEWLTAIEGLAIDAAAPLLVLAVLVDRGLLGTRVAKLEIAEAVLLRARRSATFMRELPEAGGPGQDPGSTLAALEARGFPGLASLTGPLLRIQAKQLDTRGFGSDPATLNLVRELLELLWLRYFARANKSATALPPMIGRDGETVDARFDVEVVGDRSSVVFHSRGGASGGGPPRNAEYGAGLVLLLERLTKFGTIPLVVDRIEVDSTEAHKLDPERRRLRPVGFPEPLVLQPSTDPEALARAIRTAAQQVKAKPGTRGGNDTKRLRLTLTSLVPAGELWRALLGPQTKTGAGQRRRP